VFISSITHLAYYCAGVSSGCSRIGATQLQCEQQQLCKLCLQHAMSASLLCCWHPFLCTPVTYWYNVAAATFRLWLPPAQVAGLIGADPKEIIFTSGATESNNMAIKGVANFYKDKKRHIVTSQTEHKCVLDSAR
jgi:hypothetical protein